MRRSALACLLALTTLVACTGDDGQQQGVVQVDEELPVVQGVSVDGEEVSTSDLRGEPAVLNVWATWCGPCQTELPELVETASRYDGRVGFLGVLYVDDADAADGWEEDYGIPYPSIDDDAGALADDLGFLNLPHTLVVDAAGTVRYRIFGETDADELSGLLDGLLAERSAA